MSLHKFQFTCCTAIAALLLACGTDAVSDREDAGCNGGKCDDAEGDEGFEFVIVGSGAGGGPLAANLARNGHRVLLLEAGQDMGDSPIYQVPTYHGKASEDPELAWSYFVDHYDDEEQALRDTKMSFNEDGSRKGILYPRGGTLGGSTAVNAMIAVKPHDSDWNAMVELTGDESWSAENMDPYFDRVEQWLTLSRPDPTLLIFELRLQQIVMAGAMTSVSGFFASVGQLFGMLGKDVNKKNASKEGIYLFPQAIEDGKRRGTRDYLVDTVEAGFPLTIQTGALVTNVVFADERNADGDLVATGVEFMLGDSLYGADPNADLNSDSPEKEFVEVSGEVILSAGAFNSPQLLKLSGIGPREELAELGQEALLDAPGVGQNLQDRYEVGVIGSIDGEWKMLRDCTMETDGSDPCFQEWQNGKGPFTTNGAMAAILKRSNEAELDPNLFIFGLPAFFQGYYPDYHLDALADKSHFTWAVLEGHTQNRDGRVRLRSLDPRATPEINFKYFEEGTNENGEADHDLEAMVDGIEHARKVQDMTNTLMIFDDYVEELPGEELDTREELRDWVRDEAWGHHACCTVKMGGDDDPTAVLDSRFRVRGTEGLRVVDASIFPRIPGLFIVMPIYMTSEKATDVILEDLGETRIEENMP